MYLLDVLDDPKNNDDLQSSNDKDVFLAAKPMDNTNSGSTAGPYYANTNDAFSSNDSDTNIKEEQEEDYEEFDEMSDNFSDMDVDDMSDGWMSDLEQDKPAKTQEPTPQNTFPSLFVQPAAIQTLEPKSFIYAVHSYIDRFACTLDDKDIDASQSMEELAFEAISANNWKMVITNCKDIFETLNDKDECSASEPFLVQAFCVICESSETCLSVTPSCDHQICIDCWRRSIRVNLSYYTSRTSVYNPYTLKCLCKNCNASIGGVMFRALVLDDTDLIHMYEYLFMRSFFRTVEKNDHIKTCVNSNCNNVAVCTSILPPSEAALVFCACGYQWCYHCHNADIGSHYPLTCYQIQTLISFGKSMRRTLSNGDDELLAMHASLAVLKRMHEYQLHIVTSLSSSLSQFENGVTDFSLVTAKLCPYCRTNYLFRPPVVPSETPQIVCCKDGCGLSFCWQCEEVLQTSVHHRCAWDVTPVIDSKDSDIPRLLKHCRICPHCASVVEKTAGCNTVKCHCDVVFCWNCDTVLDSKDGGHTAKPHTCRPHDKAAEQDRITRFLLDNPTPPRLLMATPLSILPCIRALKWSSDPEAIFYVIAARNLIYWCEIFLILLPFVQPSLVNSLFEHQLTTAMSHLRQTICINSDIYWSSPPKTVAKFLMAIVQLLVDSLH